MAEVSVLIPVYKSSLSSSEARSLGQCLQVLGAHPIQLVAPAGLDTSEYDRCAGRSLAVEYFEPAFFGSVRGYSQLLVSKVFYQRFEAHEYILIYQLDAWVFSDQLLHWCRRSYDYIGAPCLDAPPLPAGTVPLLNLSKYLKNKAANGGLSLRRAQARPRWAPRVARVCRCSATSGALARTCFVS